MGNEKRRLHLLFLIFIKCRQSRFCVYRRGPVYRAEDPDAWNCLKYPPRIFCGKPDDTEYGEKCLLHTGGIHIIVSRETPGRTPFFPCLANFLCRFIYGTIKYIIVCSEE